jgi:hypothetical protein
LSSAASVTGCLLGRSYLSHQAGTSKAVILNGAFN